MNRDHRLHPRFQVRVNGTDLPAKAVADLLTVSVHDDLKLPSMFTLHLINWNMSRLEVTWSDADLFVEGNEVEIQMGYADNLQTLIVGEVTSLEPEFSSDAAPSLTVRGYDRRHRLMRGRKTRSFVQLKDSDIASQVAGDAGLSVEAEDSEVVLEYVLQHNQTDLEFLQQRARDIGYEVTVDGRTLVFRPVGHGQEPALTLSRVRDVIEFYPRLTTLSQVGEIAVRGWNAKEKDEIVAGADANGSTMQGSSPGPEASDRAFNISTAVNYVNRPVYSRAEADQIAAGKFTTMALDYITGEGVCIGRPGLRAGTVVAIEGMGQRFSGHYFVSSATHTYLPASGYRVAFTVRRSAS